MPPRRLKRLELTDLKLDMKGDTKAGHKVLQKLDSNSDLDTIPGLEKLKDLDDVFEAIDMCEEYGIAYDDLEDLDEFIERIRLHFIKLLRPDSRKKLVSDLTYVTID
ncbi:hypothetical protein ACF0H5_014483 [Mactra antiquata]